MFIDLERLLPSMGTSWLLSQSADERRRYLRESGDYYASAAESFVEEAIREAESLAVLPSFVSAMRRFAEATDGELDAAFNIEPHPLNELWRPFAVRHARVTIRAGIRLLK